MESWRPIPGYPLYIVSDAGNIKLIYSADLRLLTENSFGYLRIALREKRGTKQRKFMVHRLVLLAFVGPCPPEYECNHKNGIKSDNRLENLEYVTRKYNQWHCNHVIKTRESQKGSKHGRHKLTEIEVLEIRALQGKLSMREVAVKFKVNVPSICLIWNRKTWRHIL